MAALSLTDVIFNCHLFNCLPPDLTALASHHTIPEPIDPEDNLTDPFLLCLITDVEGRHRFKAIGVPAEECLFGHV